MLGFELWERVGRIERPSRQAYQIGGRGSLYWQSGRSKAVFIYPQFFKSLIIAASSGLPMVYKVELGQALQVGSASGRQEPATCQTFGQCLSLFLGKMESERERAPRQMESIRLLFHSSVVVFIWYIMSLMLGQVGSCHVHVKPRPGRVGFGRMGLGGSSGLGP